ncbi:MAG: hypothetical protein AAGD07_14225 [Planctomycetota bacterium]
MDSNKPACFATPWPCHLLLGVCVFVSGISGTTRLVQGEDRLLQAVNGVGPNGAGHAEAISALNKWGSDTGAETATERLWSVLATMKEAEPRGKNWLRLVASDLLQKAENENSGSGLAEKFLSTRIRFIRDRSHDPDARYLIYRSVIRGDDGLRDELLSEATDDPSLPLRYLAVAAGMKRAEAMKEPQPVEAKTLYQSLVRNARHPDQIRSIAKALDDLGEPVDLAKTLAMIRQWEVIASFNNTDGVGFAAAYPVERVYLDASNEPAELLRSFQDEDETLDWQTVQSDDAMGVVDLNPVYDNAKNAVAYAYCQFRIAEDVFAGDGELRQFQVRLGSKNANKAWMNGVPVLANEVYHSGGMIDQYVGVCGLRPGLNSILLKICQNNQTQPWAQEFQFQFRITDSTGQGIPVEMVSE